MSDVVSVAKARLVFSQPFFGSLAMYLKDTPTKDPRIPRAATDGRRLFYNEAWFESLTPLERVGVLAHEVMHPALGHVYSWRRCGRQEKRWNFAGDYAINIILQDSHFTLPEGCCLNGSFRDMNAEQIYNLLPPMEEESLPGIGGDIIEVGDEEELEKDWTYRLISSYHIANQRGQGYVPAGIERFIKELLQPRVPWYDILSHLVSEATRDDYDSCRYDRRYLPLGFYLPDIYNEKCYAVVGIDTSGSISAEELREFLSETFALLHTRNISKIRLMSCDAAVHYDQVLFQGDAIPGSVPGGGGTSFVPVFERIKDEGDRPSVLIYLTDLQGSFPDWTPEYPVFWITKTKGTSVPFGRIIDFN